jgi:hypothetical protein
MLPSLPNPIRIIYAFLLSSFQVTVTVTAKHNPFIMGWTYSSDGKEKCIKLAGFL